MIKGRDANSAAKPVRVGLVWRHSWLSTLVLTCVSMLAYQVTASEGPSREERLAARKELTSIGVQFSVDALIQSIRENDEIAFELLLAAGVDVGAYRGATTPLLAAINHSRMEMAEALVGAGADLDTDDDRVAAALLDAIAQNDAAAFGLLLAAGVDPNVRRNDTTPLLTAVSHARTEMARRLIAAGAEVDAADGYGETALHHSANMDCVALLIAAGASVNVTSFAGETPLWRAATVYRHVPFVSALLTAGADPGVVLNGMPGWLTALEAGDWEIAELLVAAGADVDREIEGGHTALSRAAEGGHGQMVARLIALGADPTSALDVVVRTGRAESVALLLEHGADASQGPCALVHAARQFESDMLSILLEGGADANGDERCKWGTSPLLATLHAYPPGWTNRHRWTPAILQTKREMMVALIEGGADVNRSHNHNRANGVSSSLIHAAAYMGEGSEFMELLIEAGANVNATDSLGQTPLHVATDSPHYDDMAAKVQILIDACATLDVRDLQGETAIEKARSRRSSSGVHRGVYDRLKRAKRRQKGLEC